MEEHEQFVLVQQEQLVQLEQHIEGIECFVQLELLQKLILQVGIEQLGFAHIELVQHDNHILGHKEGKHSQF